MLKDGQTVKYPGTKNDPYIRAPEDKVAFKSTETVNFGKKKKKSQSVKTGLLIDNKAALTNYEDLLY